MVLKTRQPTGQPSWPIILLAGREKAGKSWALAQASASPIIGRTLWIGIGEDDPDEYALVPGARFEIVEHDGSYRSILQAVRDAVAEPQQGGLPTLIGVDSMTRLWNLIGDNAQAIANKRAKGRRNESGDYTITPDLWNQAAKEWTDVLDALREHQGPVIVTARLESVTVMENGQPTSKKEWKVQGHKSLPYDVGLIVHMTERGKFQLVGVRSTRMQIERERPWPGFTVDAAWRELGLADTVAGARTHATIRPEVDRDWVAEVRKATVKEDARFVWQAAKKDGAPQDVLDQIATFASSLPDAEPTPAAAPVAAQPEARAAEAPQAEVPPTADEAPMVFAEPPTTSSEWPVTTIPDGEPGHLASGDDDVF
jgi:hypothetical protein